MLLFHHHSAFYLFLLLPICVAIYLFYINWKKNQIKKIGDEELVKKMFNGLSPKWNKLQFLLFIIGLFLLTLSLADPVSNGAQQSIKTQSKEIVFALDLSNSMNATDVMPSRLAKAKQLITHFIDNNLQDKVGLVVFAGNAYISVPITIDVESIKMNLSAIETNSLPTQGTNLSEAISRAFDCFNVKRLGGKAIVLISDGEDHEEGIDKAINQCKQNNINIITVGVGTTEGSKIIDPNTNEPKVDENGNVVITKLNDDELQKIAKNAKGNYIHLDDVNANANDLNNALNALTSSDVNEENFTTYNHYFQLLLLPAMILLAISLFYIPKQKHKALYN